jgi:glycosyltransferase involved in cell wall biosynthesis
MTSPMSARPAVGRAALSHGYLPMTALQGDGVTAVRVFDLESGYAPATVPLGGAAATGAQDQLLLARLHGQPIAIVHLASEPGAETRQDLLSAVWQEGSAEIQRHIDRCRCLPSPASAEELGTILTAATGRCACSVPPRPSGHAAVIVCTVGRLDVLERTLDSLAKMRCNDWHIVVVDNRPGVGETKALVEQFAAQVRIRYVVEPRPGLGIARNAGVASASEADYVAFTDDDVVLDEDWLAWLLAPFCEDRVEASTGLVMPLSLDSIVQKRFEIYAGFGKGLVRDVFSLHMDRQDDRFRLIYPFSGGMFGSGNSMAFRREALIAQGGFDPALGAGTPTGGGEDIAAFTDLILRGGRLVYEPRSVCWHEHRSDSAGLDAQMHNYGIGLSAVCWRYLWKDWRFSARLIASLPFVVRSAKGGGRSKSGERSLTGTATGTWIRGWLLGPWRYMVSSWKAKRG